MVDEKMIPEKDMVSYKKQVGAKIDKLEKENTNLKALKTQAESQISTLKANLEDDEEVKKVRNFLLDEETRLNKIGTSLDEREGAASKRERAAQAKEIAAELKAQGLEVEEQSLIDAEDMWKMKSDLLVDFLSKENKEKKAPENPAENVFDAGHGGIVQKDVWDMTDEEFEKHDAQLKKVALSRK